MNVIEGNASQVYELLKGLAYGTPSTPGVEQTGQVWQANARHLEYSKAALQAIARELGITGASRMHKTELIATITCIDPERLSA